MLGIGLSIPQVAESSTAFSPLALFAAGEAGVWYDPSDLTTLFQDNLGNTPVTATGQSVGLILDKSRGAPTGNELLTNGDFSSGSTGWTTTGTAAVSNGTLVFSASANGDSASQVIASVVAGRTYLVTYTVVSISGGSVSSAFASTLGTSRAVAGTYSDYLVASSATFILRARSASTTAVVDNISVKEIPGIHAVQATSASRPTYQIDANGKAYLNFDGSNDSLATPSVNFSGSNKMTVCAGITKSSDAAQGVVAELTATIASNNGGFLLAAPNSAAGNYNFANKGTTQVDNIITTYTAPITNVVTGQGDISAPSNIIRVNGAQVGSAITSSQGTGNYANAALNIGRRGGSTLPFNGRIYSLIVRGAATSAGDVAKMEAWVNSKTSAY